VRSIRPEPAAQHSKRTDVILTMRLRQGITSLILLPSPRSPPAPRRVFAYWQTRLYSLVSTPVGPGDPSRRALPCPKFLFAAVPPATYQERRWPNAVLFPIGARDKSPLLPLPRLRQAVYSIRFRQVPQKPCGTSGPLGLPDGRYRTFNQYSHQDSITGTLIVRRASRTWGKNSIMRRSPATSPKRWRGHRRPQGRLSPDAHRAVTAGEITGTTRRTGTPARFSQ
jgi:hypothetical protein